MLVFAEWKVQSRGPESGSLPASVAPDRSAPHIGGERIEGGGAAHRESDHQQKFARVLDYGSSGFASPDFCDATNTSVSCMVRRITAVKMASMAPITNGMRQPMISV